MKMSSMMLIISQQKPQPLSKNLFATTCISMAALANQGNERHAVP
jgi:hypothetical protein